jgi:hypothetical protein
MSHRNKRGRAAFEKAYRLPSSRASPQSARISVRVARVTITSTIADLTGRAPRTVAEFAREHASSFGG